MNTTERGHWNAVLRRDPAADGRFVFAVTTTGIYCRPSCPARRPRVEHVRFYGSPKVAEREGYRACKRCGPKPALTLRICEYLRRHLDEKPTLSVLAREAGLSPFHLQRLFKRALGVSPREYLELLRFEEFRKRGKGSTLSSAIYGAGFGSMSRIYERARSWLGMTPKSYQKGGAGMSIAYDLIACPLGRALIAATPLGICAVAFGDSDAALTRDLKRRFPRATLRREPTLLRHAGSALKRIFDGGDVSLPLDVRATAFQARVWKELRRIPRGTTRSYSDIARRIGRPRSVRAVATACAGNPVALLIPCHRVVGADGSLTGYRWGLARKETLLSSERR